MGIYDEQRQADALDAAADETSEPLDFYAEDEISAEERNACDHYNERYVQPHSD